MTQVPYFVVDAFASKPFSGNPAAICWVGTRKLSAKLMQQIASEINLSETAFVTTESDNGDEYVTGSRFGLRWFTPTNEVPLCGHATLAAAATLFYKAHNRNCSVTFSTLSGDLFARKSEDGIILDFPANKPTVDRIPYMDLKPLCDAIFGTSEVDECDDYCGEYPGEERGGVSIAEALKSRPNRDIHEMLLSSSAKKLLIRMPDAFTRDDLERIRPDFVAMETAHAEGLFRGVIVTCRAPPADAEHDFYSRYFAPWNGIREDPVTGSAHTVLAPYWRDVMGRARMRARQCSSRGGDVVVTVRDDGRVDIAGSAKVVVEGKLTVPLE